MAANRELNPISSLFREAGKRKEETPIQSIGVILYDGGKKLVGVGVDSKGALRCKYSEDEELVASFKAQDKGSGRILSLDECSEVLVVQVGVGAFEIGRFGSIRQQEDSVFAHLRYTDPKSQKAELFTLEEKALLELITGENGGIAVLYGGGVPEENALVIKQSIGEQGGQTRALVAFLHPEKESAWGLESVQGVFEFFQRVVKEYIEEVGAPIFGEIDRALEKEVKSERVKESGVRLAILRAQLFAHARLFELTGEREHQEFLLKYLPSLRQGLIARLADFLTGRKRRSAAETVDRLVIDGEQRRGEARVRPSGEPMEPQTESCRKLYDYYHGELGEDFGSNKVSRAVDAMDRYLLLIIGLLKKAAYLDELADIGMMLEEIRGVPYAERKIRCYSLRDYNNPLDTGNYFVEWDYGTHSYEARGIIDILQECVNEKKAKLLERELRK